MILPNVVIPMLIRGKKLTHRLLGNLLQLGGGGEDRCKLENIVF